MYTINPYIQILQKISERLQGRMGIKGPEQLASPGSDFINPFGVTDIFRSAMLKAKSYENDAGAAATGDLAARVRIAGKEQGITGDIALDQAIKETRVNAIKQQLHIGNLWAQV